MKKRSNRKNWIKLTFGAAQQLAGLCVGSDLEGGEALVVDASLRGCHRRNCNGCNKASVCRVIVWRIVGSAVRSHDDKQKLQSCFQILQIL